jgi:hypothetical protein
MAVGLVRPGEPLIAWIIVHQNGLYEHYGSAETSLRQGFGPAGESSYHFQTGWNH